jgi:hypothetical protein
VAGGVGYGLHSDRVEALLGEEVRGGVPYGFA